VWGSDRPSQLHFTYDLVGRRKRGALLIKLVGLKLESAGSHFKEQY